MKTVYDYGMIEMIYLVTRHNGAIEWLRAKGYDGVVEPHLERDQITGGNLYIGILPIPTVKEILDAGSRFFLVVLPDLAFEQRGQEMTPDQMDRAGAHLLEVRSIGLQRVDMVPTTTEGIQPYEKASR